MKIADNVSLCGVDGSMYLKLGAPLYMPATRGDLVAIGNGTMLPQAWTVIFCTEDAILETEVPQALAQLEHLLPLLKGTPFALGGESSIPFRCIRPRSPEVLERLLTMQGICSIHGFVLPKVSSSTLQHWVQVLKHFPQFNLMLSLETKDVFDAQSMHRLCDMILTSPLRDRIVCLRIGALDLLSLLSLRRSCRKTIYETPIGLCIYRLIHIFGAAGLPLSAPAFECLNDREMLAEELEMDVSNGLFCKTALHPAQLPLIHEAYRVADDEFSAAKALMDPQRPAVFSMHGRMCEKATHTDWAKRIMMRAEIYGTVESC